MGEPAGLVSTRAVVSSAPVSSAPTVSSTSSVMSVGPVTPKAKRTTTKELVEFRVIPFKKRTVTDDSVPKGEKSVRTAGADGTRRLTYRVTYVDGVQTAKRLVRQAVVKEPRTQVTVVGTNVDEPAQSNDCDPNYSGCVPIASDVDCAGGSGNGPEYVQGPIEVIGTDIYRLDADHDGIACE